MASTAITALRVSNEAFLIASTIERCPKTMMLRELVMNALEAARDAASLNGRVEIRSVEVGGVRKLSIWNTAVGLTMEELERMADLASSIRKETSLDQNFGMGAKVASLPSNKFGLRYRSCLEGRVFQTLLGQRDGVYGRIHDDDAEGRSADVTAACRLEGADLSHDWVEVVLFGNAPEQDTVADPYGGNPTVGRDWVLDTLQRRLFRIPAGVELWISADVAGTDRPVVFAPEDRRAGAAARSETVQATPDISVQFSYMPDLKSGDSALLGAGGIVHRDEIYGLVDGTMWNREAVACGLPFGARYCTVFVELSAHYKVRPETYRQFLRFTDGDQRQVVLRDFAGVIRNAMPGWLRDVVASFAPAEVDFMGEVRRDLRELIEDLDIAPQRRDSLLTRGAPDRQVRSDEAHAPGDPPPSMKLFERPPEIITVRDQAGVDERELNGRAASYTPATHQLFVNMQYPAIVAMQMQLKGERPWESDPSVVDASARIVAEWAVTHRVARAVVYSLSKRRLGWGHDETARAQSPESLSIAADDFSALMPPARSRLADTLGEPLTKELDAKPSAREAVRAITELMQARQAARAKLGQGVTALPFLRRVSEIELAQGNQAEAEQWIEQALRIATSDPWIHKQHATVLQARGALEDAQGSLMKALALNPQSKGPFEEHLSHLSVQRKEMGEALRWAEAAVASQPQSVWSVYHLSTMKERLGDGPGAVETLQKAVEADIRDAGILMRRLSELAMRAGDAPAADRWAERALAANPADPQNHVHLSRLREQQGDLDGAWEAAEAALETAPSRPAPFLRRASEIALRRQSIFAALSRAEEAVDNGREPASYVQLAKVYRAIGDLDGAERIVAEAIVGLKAPSVDVYRQAADIAMRRADLELAKQRIVKAIETNPTDPWSYHTQSFILEKAGDLDGAAQAAAKAVEHAAEPSGFMSRAVDIALAQRNTAAAQEWANKMLAAKPGDPRSFLPLSRVRQREGDLAAAADLIEQALRLAKPTAPVLRRASEIAKARGDGAAALVYGRQATEADPRDPWGYHYLSFVLQEVGDLPGASEAARKAVDLGTPDSKPFHDRAEYLDWQLASKSAA